MRNKIQLHGIEWIVSLSADWDQSPTKRKKNEGTIILLKNKQKTPHKGNLFLSLFYPASKSLGHLSNLWNSQMSTEWKISVENEEENVISTIKSFWVSITNDS